jgi:hypothetical protein
MARRKEVEWLLNELPALTASGVLTREAAEGVRRHYADQLGEARSWLGMILTTIGALLIGGGIISLLAYNWEHLSRGTRAALSFLPLVVGQIGAGCVLWKSPARRVAAQEGWATFLFLAMGACLGLIAQTYHLGGRFGTFLLVWMLLGFPIAFVLEAVAPALLALAGFTAWTFMWKESEGSGLWLWPLAAATMAASWPVLRQANETHRARLLGLAAAVVFLIAVGFTISELGDEYYWRRGFAYLLYLSAGAALYLFSECAQESRWRNPATPGGQLGALVVWGLALALTYHALWRDGDIASPWGVLRSLKSADPAARITGVALFAALATAVGVGWARAIRLEKPAALWLGSAPIVLAGAMVLERPLAATVLMNAYVLAAGVAGIVLGVRERNARRAYVGLGTVTLLIGFRFFDVDIGFIARGVVFIVLGIAFLAAQRILARHMKEAP